MQTSTRFSPVLPALLSLVAAGFAAGCNTDPSDKIIDVVFDACEPLVVAPDDDTTADQMDALRASIEMWNRAANTKLTLEEIDGAPRLPVRFERAAAAFYGFYDDVEAKVYINNRLEDDESVITLAHEFGHAFGLYHVEKHERPSLMNPGNLDLGPTKDDVEQLQAEWGVCP